MPHVIDEDEFPYLHFFVLLSSGFASGMALTGLFPYVAFMTVDLGAAANVDKAGYVSGYIASAFMFGRLLTSFYWGRVADRIGRKPVFYIACVSTAVSSLLFGFSVNLYMAIASRVFLGLMNPTVGLIKTVVSELCAPKDQTFAMSVVSASWSIGLVVGPSIGGWTARPAVQYPGTWIADIRVFAEFPYLLPNLITALFCCISMVFIWLYLPETLGAIVATKGEYEMVRVTADDEPGRDPESGENTDVGSGVNRTDNPPSDNAEGDDATLPGSAKGDDSGMLSSLTGLMRIEAVRVSLLAYFALSYVAIVYDEIVPLWALSSLSKGGLAYSSKEVGFVISFTGVPMVLFTVLIFPALSKRLGTIRGFQWGFFLTSAFGIGVMLSPFLCDWVLPTWLPMLPVLLFMTSCAKMASCMAFTSTFLIINAAVPSNLRGTVNGLAMTFGSIAKALGPSVGSVIFASAIHSSLPLPLSYLLVFLMNFAIASLTILLLPMSSLFDGFQTESSTAKDSSSDKSRGVAVEADGGVTETHTHATPRNSIS